MTIRTYCSTLTLRHSTAQHSGHSEWRRTLATEYRRPIIDMREFSDSSSWRWGEGGGPGCLVRKNAAVNPRMSRASRANRSGDARDILRQGEDKAGPPITSSSAVQETEEGKPHKEGTGTRPSRRRRRQKNTALAANKYYCCLMFDRLFVFCLFALRFFFFFAVNWQMTQKSKIRTTVCTAENEWLMVVHRNHRARVTFQNQIIYLLVVLPSFWMNAQLAKLTMITNNNYDACKARKSTRTTTQTSY